MLQGNVAEEVGVRGRIEYKSWNRKVKELVKESKKRVDEEFGRSRVQNSVRIRSCFGKKLREREEV
ncbi:MAG: hypothetical protein DSY42_03535 [Aquifex sp.]|nr:MAG: hypothetical protein DSY42_03535 [Aquifex sp.]